MGRDRRKRRTEERVTAQEAAPPAAPKAQSAEAALAVDPAVRARLLAAAPVLVAFALGLAFALLVQPHLPTTEPDFDEGWLMLDARFMARGERPYVDFAHHEMPLHLYFLTFAGDVFGHTPYGYRLVSLLSIAASGFLLFVLVRPFAGVLAALTAEGTFLFASGHVYGIAAVPETSALPFTLLGTVLLFLGRRSVSAYASAAAFVLALLVKPLPFVMVVAAALALAWGREWRRLRDFAIGGVLAAVLGLLWTDSTSDGVFFETLRFHVSRLATRDVGMWTIDSGFADIRERLGITSPWQWAVLTFQNFFETRTSLLPVVLFILSLLAIPIWVLRLTASRPALGAFAVLWPASYLFVNFVGLDFLSMRYFVPYLAFASFLFSGWVWLAGRIAPRGGVAAVAAVLCVVLAVRLTASLEARTDPWFLGRADWISRQHPTVVSFSPSYFAWTGAEPGCDFANPALTYGSFGEQLPPGEQMHRFDDAKLIDCLRAHRDVPVIVDWGFFFFTRPGSALREYLAAEGSSQLLFFSPQAMEQWNRPGYVTPSFR